MDRDTRRQDDSNARRLIEAGSNLAGTTGAATLGVIFGAGASGSASIGVVGAGVALASILREVGERLLGRREQMRVGGTAIFAARAYQERTTAGHHLRNDNWFEERPHGRSIAAEICEGTLLIAQREHEERKIEFYGYLLANISFEPSVDEYLANWLLQIADQLTWSQLVLLTVFGRKDEFTLPSIKIGDFDGDWTSWGLHRQLANLGYGQRDLIGVPRPVPKNKPAAGTFNIPQINLSLPDQELVNARAWLYPLMWLDRIPTADIELFIELLQTSNEAND